MGSAFRLGPRRLSSTFPSWGLPARISSVSRLTPSPPSRLQVPAPPLGPVPASRPFLLFAEPLSGTAVHQISVQTSLLPSLLLPEVQDLGPHPDLLLAWVLPLSALLSCAPSSRAPPAIRAVLPSSSGTPLWLSCSSLWRAGGSSKQMLTYRGHCSIPGKGT